jgi:hypothetical protein
MIHNRWLYVLAAYGSAFFILSLFMVWIIFIQIKIKKDLKMLENAGIKRRSEN